MVRNLKNQFLRTSREVLKHPGGGGSWGPRGFLGGLPGGSQGFRGAFLSVWVNFSGALATGGVWIGWALAGLVDFLRGISLPRPGSSMWRGRSRPAIGLNDEAKNKSIETLDLNSQREITPANMFLGLAEVGRSLLSAHLQRLQKWQSGPNMSRNNFSLLAGADKQVTTYVWHAGHQARFCDPCVR